MPTSKILKHLLSSNDYTEAILAEILMVSPSTVNRWARGNSRPRADKERKLRELANSKSNILRVSEHETQRDSKLRYQFDHVLLEIRESLHRRGRFSSRNDAIEEVCKLLLAQIKLLQADAKSLDKYAGEINSVDSAEKLITTINDTIRVSVPKNIKNTLGIEEFYLIIKPEEFRLLDELCLAFTKAQWCSINNVVLLDLFNETFGKFLSDSFGEEKQLGQYLTPIEVVRFMVRLAIANIDENDLRILMHPEKCVNFGIILDPSCGVGSFLVEIIHQLLPRVTEQYGNDSARIWLNNMGKTVLYGIDKSTRMLKISVTHFAAIGVNCRNLFSLNSLDRDDNKSVTNDTFDQNVSLILSNPPFGAEFKGMDIEKYKIFYEWSSNAPKKIDSELLFVERYLDWLKVGGNCVVVIPDSILTNKSLFQDLRNGMSNSISLKRVISFPQETFAAAGTTAKTSVVDFSKKLFGNTEHEVYFAICDDIGFKVSTKGTHKQKIVTKKNDLPIILSECLLHNDSIAKGRTVHLTKETRRWDATYHASLPGYIHKKINTGKDIVRLSDVAMLVNDRVDPRRSDGDFRYIEISDINSNECTVSSKNVSCSEAPSRARKLVRYGDILASTVRPEQKKVGIVTSDIDDGAVCTTGFAVLRPINISPYLLCQLLKSDFVTAQLMRNNIGVAYPAVDESCFPNLVLPTTNSKIKALGATADEVIEYQRSLQKIKSSFSSLINDEYELWMAEN